MKAGWKIIPMGQLCSISSGESDTQDAVEDGQYAFFDRSKTIKRSSRFLYDCEALIIPGEGKEFLPRHFKGKFDLHQRAYALFDFKPELDVRFLYYLLHHRSDYLPSVAVGATVKSLRRRHFEELPVPLPPLAEQKRIVALLDEAFAGIDEAKAKASASLENGIALFHSYLNSVFAHCGETWIEKPLNEVLVKTETIDPARTPRAEFDYIDVSSVSKEELVVQQAQRLLGKDAPSRARKLVRANDVIFATIRPTLRRIAIVPAELDGQVCSTGYFVLRPKGEIDHRWVFYFLQTDTFLAEMERLQKGASYPAVTDNDVRSQMIPVPSLGTQKEALEKLDDLRKETLTVSKLYEKKVLNLTELKSALLAQAFAGELTT